ncbi:MAG: type II toxin-antitoxin system RelE/ParE family toxin [Oscillospiraceae bacterium]|nr:type II toxin-antitoxin system RelE/ParE family toxin [Oscillospiraceae bacterium]MBQ6942991.1 type II toxin-antitoxin system RelE/ParE family toxin [Ruminococcus sp.]
MKYKTIVAESFKDDLDSALSYISHKLLNPIAARNLLIKTEKVVTEITENPLLFPTFHIQPIAEKGYHCALVDNYNIFYRIDEENKIIYFARFLYGKMNFLDKL